MDINDPIQAQRLRGAILQLIRARHLDQLSRMDHVMMWHMLRDIGFDLGEYHVLTYLQDLEMAGCVKFVQSKNRRTNAVEIFQIELTAEGLRHVEQLKKDGLVRF